MIRPTYEVTLSADGTVTYAGRHWCKHEGPWKAKIELALFKSLSDLIEKLHFEALTTPKSAKFPPPTDTFRITVAVSYAGRARTVAENNWDGPKNLHRIEAEIDKTIDSATNWKRVRPRGDSRLDKGGVDSWTRWK